MEQLFNIALLAVEAVRYPEIPAGIWNGRHRKRAPVLLMINISQWLKGMERKLVELLVRDDKLSHYLVYLQLRVLYQVIFLNDICSVGNYDGQDVLMYLTRSSCWVLRFCLFVHGHRSSVPISINSITFIQSSYSHTQGVCLQ